MATTIDERIERLSNVSVKKMVEPDEAITGTVGDGPVLPAELLSIAGLDLDLTPEQLAVLSREEVASITTAGIKFESVLTAGFSMDIVRRRDLTDPRVTYILHELGEETRHSRLFIRLLTQLRPQATNPLDRPLFNAIERIVLPLFMSMPAFFDVLVLTGEEIPDLLQKLASEHPDTDPFIRDVNKYHRQEEARHLAFARLVLPELWAKASWLERRLIRRLAPVVINGMFDMLVHPGVYEVVGLPGWPTWKAANRTPQRRALKHRALRPLLSALMDAGAFRPGSIPAPWRTLCGVDADGQPLPDTLDGQ
ncbi:MAG TPA: diiron oxygenase [Acidimicrobiales bacterium]|nr:diiron oxygenase [Acidimicrobiales bacterium]